MNFTLSEMCQKEIKRSGAIAEIIFDYYEGKPVRLIGFYTDGSLSDFEIYEEGYQHYKRLFEVIEDMK